MGENDEINEASKEEKGKGKIGKGVKEAKDTATQAVKLVANIETGNVIGAIKNVEKLAKSNIIKKKIKSILRKILICILILIVIAVAVLSIFNAVYEKVVELLSSVGRELKSFWKWISDDYWIRLDDDIEYTIIDDTRSGSDKKGKISR